MRLKKWLQTRLCGKQMLPSKSGEDLKVLPQHEEGIFPEVHLSPHMWVILTETRGVVGPLMQGKKCFCRVFSVGGLHGSFAAHFQEKS